MSRKERPEAQRELDIVSIVRLKRARRTSEEIAEILNADGRPEESRIKAVTVRKDWTNYLKRLAAERDKDGAKLLSESIREHEMDRAENLRLGYQYAEAGNPSAPSFFMIAHRAQLALDRLRGVKPAEEKSGEDVTAKGKKFETREEAVEYMTRVAGLGARVLPYADTRRKKR